MAESPFLPAAVARRAAADPESPFIFWPEGLDWRWWSWRQLAALAARWAAPLVGLPPAAVVGFDGSAYPQAMALDLAVQAAGLTPAPTGAGALPAGCGWWLHVEGGPTGEARVRPLDGGGNAEWPAGGLVVFDAGEWRWLSHAALAAAVARLGGMIRGAGGVAGTGGGEGPGGRAAAASREIVVAGEPLGHWGARLTAAWAVLEGAALVLEPAPDPATRISTILWARPTVALCSAGDLAALRNHVVAARSPGLLRRLLRRRSPLPPTLPKARLRVLLQAEPAEPAAVAFWRSRSVALLSLPPAAADLPFGESSSGEP